MGKPKKTMDVNLFRIRRSDHGTQGIWVAGTHHCCAIELPWRDNEQNISCIPADTYEVTLRRSPRFGLVYWLQDVDGRSYILTHWGNVAGDKSKGLKTHTAGCILLGKQFGIVWGQRAVLLSRITVKRFMAFMEGKDFTLHIHERFPILLADQT